MERLKLNEEQQKMVQDNELLAWYVINKLGLQASEYIDIAYIGLIKACATFNKDYGTKFSSYACKVINNQLKMSLRKSIKQIKETDEFGNCIIHYVNRDISINTPISKDGTDDDEITLEDTIEYNQDFDTNIYISELIDEIPIIIRVLNLKELKVFYLRLLGKKDREIAKEFGFSQSYISRLKVNAFKKLNRAYYDNNTHYFDAYNLEDEDFEEYLRLIDKVENYFKSYCWI